MHVTQLLEALDLRGTGAEAAAELEVEGLRPEGLAKRRLELESMGERLAEMSPDAQPG